jgi:hypothetical protein
MQSIITDATVTEVSVVFLRPSASIRRLSLPSKSSTIHYSPPSNCIYSGLGRVIAQAVLPPRRAGFKPRSSHVGFVVDKVALGKVFSFYFGFPCQFLFHRLLHTHHLSSGAGTIGQLVAVVPSGLSLTPHQETIKKTKLVSSVLHFLPKTIFTFMSFYPRSFLEGLRRSMKKTQNCGYMCLYSNQAPSKYQPKLLSLRQPPRRELFWTWYWVLWG